MLILVSGTFAAYTSRSFVKGVATTPKQSLGLSSDYLVVVSQNATSDKYAVRKIILDKKSDDDDTPYSFSFYIQNSSEGTVSDKSMKYSLFVEGISEGVTITRGEEDITVDSQSTEGSLAPLMPAYTKTTHFYQVKIPKELISGVSEIIIKAIPDVDSDSSGNMLAAKVQPSIAGIVAGFSYNGIFIDETNTNKPSDFAAFNFEVSVFNATEDHNMIVRWNKNYVEIDPLFLNKIGKMAEDDLIDNNYRYVEFMMGAENSEYLIRFYRLSEQDRESEWQSSWSNLKSNISFSEKENALSEMEGV